MKPVLSLVLVAGVAFSLGHFLRAPIPLAGAAGGGAGTPSGNGDVNGDGRLDIADAIYIINHQFRGGPAPVPYEDPVLLERIVQLEADLAAKSSALEACSAEVSTVKADLVTCQANLGTYGLPATGQSRSYYPGDDGSYQAGYPSEGRFIDNLDDTVTDTSTGLMWQKNCAPDLYNWWAAINYCENLDLAGHTDWRLPNVRELLSVVDYGRTFLSMDPVFEGAVERYWASSSFVDDPNNAWLVFFDVGNALANHDNFKGQQFWVRAVRKAP